MQVYEITKAHISPERITARMIITHIPTGARTPVLIEVISGPMDRSAYVWVADPMDGIPGTARPPWCKLDEGIRYVPWFIVDQTATWTPAGSEVVQYSETPVGSVHSEPKDSVLWPIAAKARGLIGP